MVSDASTPRSRWITVTVFALAVSVACVFLARWQWDRLHAREARNAVIVNNYDQPRAPLSSVVKPNTPLDGGVVWRRVETTGRYLTADEVLVRKRSLNEATGYWVLTPLRTDRGSVLWCVRGWIRAGEDARTPSAVPPAPTGTVVVTGHLRAAEGPSDDRGLPSGQVGRIDSAALSQRVDSPTYDGWLQVTDEVPAPASAPTRLPAPEVSDGPHLGYAIQWGIFAIAAWVGWWVILRRAGEDDDDEEVQESYGSGSA